MIMIERMPQNQIKDIPIENIRANPYQFRRHFEANALEELATSMRQYGFISRLQVRPEPEEGFFQLVYGERRLRAAQIAGITMIPCEIVAYTDDEMKEIGLIENVQRMDLEPLEEAMALQNLLEQKDPLTRKKKYSIRSLAKHLGKPKSYIEDHLTLLRLPQDVQNILAVQPRTSLRALIEVGKITTPDERVPLLRQLETGMLSTEEVRAIIQEIRENKVTPVKEPENIPDSLVFRRELNRNTRRMHSAIEKLEKIAHAYHCVPDQRSRELLLTHIQETLERIQHIKDTLL